MKRGWWEGGSRRWFACPIGYVPLDACCRLALAGGKNSFGNAFASAAEKTNAHMFHDGFDSAVCKVVAADYERFHENIVLELRQAE